MAGCHLKLNSFLPSLRWIRLLFGTHLIRQVGVIPSCCFGGTKHCYNLNVNIKKLKMVKTWSQLPTRSISPTENCQKAAILLGDWCVFCLLSFLPHDRANLIEQSIRSIKFISHRACGGCCVLGHGTWNSWSMLELICTWYKEIWRN